jgi:hypothetical protein
MKGTQNSESQFLAGWENRFFGELDSTKVTMSKRSLVFLIAFSIVTSQGCKINMKVPPLENMR